MLNLNFFIYNIFIIYIMVANSGNKKFTQHLFKHLPEIAGNTVIITTILIILQVYLLKAPIDGAFANGILIALLLTLN